MRAMTQPERACCRLHSAVPLVDASNHLGHLRVGPRGLATDRGLQLVEPDSLLV